MKEPAFITTEESLLIIIDMQERLVPAMSDQRALTDNVMRLLALSRIMHLPVIFTEQEKLGATLGEVSQAAPAFEAVPKTTFNCFLCEPFASKVRDTGRSTLIIAGIEAHICVAQTALWAYPQFRVHVVQDAISSRAPHNVAVAAERMRAAGITITSTEMVIYELLQRAGTEAFKAMLPYVK
jgi:nicotinamidase-related amidase